jgi:hypothetical protein
MAQVSYTLEKGLSLYHYCLLLEQGPLLHHVKENTILPRQELLVPTLLKQQQVGQQEPESTGNRLRKIRLLS